MSFQERRKLDRRPYINSIEIYSQENKKMIGKGFIMNWCEEGFGIVSSHLLEAGKKVVLFCDFPDGLEFDFVGEVVYGKERLDSSSYGVKLLPGQSSFVNKFSQQIAVA